MSEDNSNEPEQQEPERPEGHGRYHPEAARHQPYNDAMAAWFNEVRSMQQAGTLPAPREEAEPEAQQPEVPEQRPANKQEQFTAPVKDETPEKSPSEDEKAPESKQESFEGSETPEGSGEPEKEPQGDSEGGENTGDEPPAEPGQKDAPEQPSERTEPGETYDPAEHNAPNVLGYLEGVDFDEAFRVLDLEEQGRARKGILNHRDEILERAQGKSTEATPSE